MLLIANHSLAAVFAEANIFAILIGLVMVVGFIIMVIQVVEEVMMGLM